MKELLELAAEASRQADELSVIPQIHLDDFIFQFLIGNPCFEDHTKAVRYYFQDGKESARKLRALIEELRPGSDPDISILEFASGYGCVTRHLVREFRPENVTASDIHAAAMDFIGQFLRIKTINSKSKPGDFPATIEYDVVFALSFFSHMPITTWSGWVKALFHCVSDGGLLVFTTQGLRSRPYFGDPEVPRDGFWFRPESEQKDLDTSEYGQTIVTEAFVGNALRNTINRNYDVYREGYWWGHQDLYVVRK